MKIASLLVIALAACSSGSDVTPTANGVFPSSGYQGRSLRVEITGDATTWDARAAVSFGSGITVSNVSAASPTDLFADIAIDPAAPAGLQDVTVTDGTTAYTLAQAFEIDAPGSLTKTGGVLAQGSIVFFTIATVDTQHPFDTTQGYNAAGDLIYTNLLIDAPAGVTPQITTATPFQIEGVMLIDVDASPGDLAVESGPAGSAITTALGALDVATRAPAAITAGAPITGAYGAVYDSQLYAFTPGKAPDYLGISIGTADTSAIAGFDFGYTGLIILPTGHFAEWNNIFYSDDSYPYGGLNPTQAGSAYAIFFDDYGASNYSYTLAMTDENLPNAFDLANPATTYDAAPAITLPAFGSDGVASSIGFAWLAFDVGSGDVGKSIHLVNSGTAAMVFDVYASGSDAASDTLFDAGEANYTTMPIAAAGTYYLRLQEDPDYSSGDDYALGVFLQ